MPHIQALAREEISTPTQEWVSTGFPTSYAQLDTLADLRERQLSTEEWLTYYYICTYVSTDRS